MQQLLAEMDLP